MGVLAVRGTILLLSVISTLGAPPNRPPRQVTTDTRNGDVIGQVVRKSDGSTTTQFLGVPYAQAPTKKNRFKRPKPVIPWPDAPLYATEHPPLCPQNMNGTQFWMHPEAKNDLHPTTNTSEDCLFLNIYLEFDPESNSKQLPRLKLPVMVFFHGGGFQVGGPDQYSLARLAHFGGVMVVGVQYRLNVFGFLSTGVRTGSGNYGLYDQLEALKWINKNINSFGGNSLDVTIFGNAAGGTSVGYHVMSRLSTNKFKGAISMSGSALSPTIGHPKRTQNLTITLGQLLDCNKSSLKVLVDCLRDKETDEILYALTQAEKQTEYRYMPMVDGEFILQDPLEQAKRGEFNNNDVYYMIGVTSDEGYWYQKNDIPFDLNIGANMIQFEDTLRDYFGKETAFRANYEQIMGIIRTEYGHCDDDMSRSKGLTDAFGEYSVIAPAYRFTELFSKYNSVYFYEFAHRPPHWKSPLRNGEIPDYVRASHYADINYIFGDVRYLIPTTDQSEKELAITLLKMWANFAKNGDPNSPDSRLNHVGTLEWKPFKASEPYYLHITTGLNDTNLKKDFRPRQMTFWNQYMPFLLADEACDESADYCVYDAARALNYEVLTYSLCAFSLVLLLLVLILTVKVAFPECCARGDDTSNGEATLVKAVPVEEKEKLSNLSKDIDEISESDL